MLLALAILSALAVFGMSRIGALDHPVARSSHTRPTPKGGGVGIALAFAAGMLLARHRAAGDAVLTGAALFLAACSYADDVLDWPFWRKLAAQAASGLAILLAGFSPWHVSLPGLGIVPLPVVAPAMGLAWVLFVTNAVNFMDGLNGLAAGSAAIGCIMLAWVAGIPHAWPECLIAAGVAGFLPFNYPAARIFMGDVGSQFLGFAMAALALRHAADAHLSLILPLSLAPLLLDAACTLIRRWLRGERITQAHRGHFYQVAHRTGMPAWIVTLLYWAMACLGGASGALCGAGSSLVPAAFCLLVFGVWAIFVTRRARQAALGAW
jgi:UDP-GlcNAc:undecaprenyl-phosphate GlcNAc-1-phosphate transferase